MERAIVHDPQIFEKPFDFIPERYLKDGKIDRSIPDAELAAFGHGRRYVSPSQFKALVLIHELPVEFVLDAS